jgi:hypothetical protein
MTIANTCTRHARVHYNHHIRTICMGSIDSVINSIRPKYVVIPTKIQLFYMIQFMYLVYRAPN